MAPSWTLDRVRELDADDELAAARQRFVVPEGLIYLDGNSLGPLAAGVSERVRRVVDLEWGSGLIGGWTESGWMQAPERVGDAIARLIGARSGEVVVVDTTTIALTKLLGAALIARPERRVILSSTDNFPSDLYAAAGVARIFGGELRIVEPSEVVSALDSDVAVCCLTQVDFRTGFLHDLPGLTARAHEVGALSLWDLCHSAGAVVVGCEDNGVDLAVGCTYKYLNGGPGAQSFLYVRESLQDELENPLPGWLGHETPFDFDSAWRPAKGIRRFVTSSPPIVAVAALEAALEAFEGIEIGALRAKSEALGQLFIDTIEDLAPSGITVASPREPQRRGSQVSLRHDRARSVIESAAAKGVVGDFRPPDLCRFGLAPVYLSYEEVFKAAEIVAAVAETMVISA
ncbi:MAG: kynureninase [Acidimicrobiales bacterium]